MSSKSGLVDSQLLVPSTLTKESHQGKGACSLKIHTGTPCIVRVYIQQPVRWMEPLEGRISAMHSFFTVCGLSSSWWQREWYQTFLVPFFVVVECCMLSHGWRNATICYVFSRGNRNWPKGSGPVQTCLALPFWGNSKMVPCRSGIKQDMSTIWPS